MRVLVTGASGFVGRHLTQALRRRGHDVVAAGGMHDGADYAAVDVTDTAAVGRFIAEVAPQAVFHLAAQAFVPVSIDAPLATVAVNALGTANVLEGIRTFRESGGERVRLIAVSSADVYGVQPPDRMPLAETTPLRPSDPYAASKASAESFGLAWSRTYDLDVVIARPFNHIGPGQDERFVVASFAHQLARIAAGGDHVLRVGNLDAQRDFLDVRDVVRAYLALLESGRSGEVYNICSGRAVAIREVLRQLITIARVPVEVRDEPERLRPSDVPIVVGDATKLRTATGWDPKLSLAESLRDIYADARERVAAVGA
jgi:GDP-4-dehydro-6-deoxy-D-mannose reductase